MKELINLIDAEFSNKEDIFLDKYFKWKIYRSNFESKIEVPKSQLNKIIDNLNLYWKSTYGTDDVYSVNDTFLLVCVQEEKLVNYESGGYINCFSTMTFDEFGLNVFNIYLDDNDQVLEIGDFNFQSWKELDHIELVYLTVSKDPHLRFYYINSTSYEDIPFKLLNIYGSEGAQFLIELFTKIAKFSQSTDQKIDDKAVEIFDEVEKLIEKDKNYLKALEVLETYNEVENDLGFKLSNFKIYHFVKIECLAKLNKIDECLNYIDYCISYYKEDKEITSTSMFYKAIILSERGEFFNSLKYLNNIEELIDDNHSLKSEVLLLKKEILKEIEDNFIQIPRNERKMLLVSKETFRSSNESFIALNINNIRNLNFPMGHPQLNEVYVAHPRRSDYYLPLNNSSEELIVDRITELETLLQSLGATYLNISSNKSDINQEKSNEKKNVNVKVDVKIHGGEIDVKNVQDINSFSDLDSRISHTQSFQPFKKPYVPNDLVWYHSDLNWQKLARQRLEGNLLTHAEIISLSQVENISSQEIQTINADLKAFFVKAGVKYSKDIELESKSNKKQTWTLSVEFEDIRKLNEVHVQLNSEENITIDQTLNPYIAKYKEDVQFMLEDDGIIDEGERKMLDRKIEKYGFTKEGATQIEKELMFNNEELKYIEEYKILLAEGEIGEMERNILRRYAKRFNINADRQKDLEQNIN